MASEVYLILLLFFAQSTALDLIINKDEPYIKSNNSDNMYAIAMYEEMAVPIKLGSFVYTGNIIYTTVKGYELCELNNFPVWSLFSIRTPISIFVI